MSERSLAHIERVTKVESIDGADRIEKVTVLGWQVVCRKGEVREEDLVCYIELDSVVPEIPYFEFMRDRKFRVKTIKLKGCISQGLIVTIDNLREQLNKYYIPSIGWDLLNEGKDVTKELKIIKYESPSDKEQNFISKKKHNFFIKYMTRFNWFGKLFKIKSKSFPEWISKTDEVRIQNNPSLIKKVKEVPYYITEKIDGQSATYWIKKKLFGYEFGICSRTVRKFENDGSNWSKIAKQFDIKNKLIKIRKEVGFDIAIQGEIISPKIQGGKYHNNKHINNLCSPFDFFIFNIFNINKKEYIDFRLFASHLVDFKIVPYTIIQQLPDTIDEVIKFSEGKSVLAETEREGIVVRSCDQSISFKVISNKYLLKEE